MPQSQIALCLLQVVHVRVVQSWYRWMKSKIVLRLREVVRLRIVQACVAEWVGVVPLAKIVLRLLENVHVRVVQALKRWIGRATAQ